MKTIYKTNPKRILGYLMAFAMVFFTTNVTGQCTNSSSYGSGIAPTSGTNTISTCNYLSEKSTISGVVAGATYTNNIQIGGATVGYVTIVEGNGITHHGPAPLTWTADTSGSVTGHWNVDASCATATGCHTTTIMYGAPALGCMSATACNYDSTANMDDGSCTYPGCTDPLAVNYSASAGCDDGSCMYSCTAAPYSEDFEAGMGTWTTANTGTGSYPGWYRDSGGTPSSATGPSSGANASTWYMHIETSGTGGPYTLTSECLDISALTVPSLNFQYHMYGASMGSLDVTVNGTNVFTMSGDQGDQWHQAQIDLSAFIGSDIVVEFTGARGTSYTGDMAIDQVDVIEYAVIVTPGCMDSLAYNYNANANVDDSSCLYGCPAGATAVTLPYSGSGLTNCGNGNSVNSAAAGAGYLGSYYLNGEDASYEWTASSNEVVQVDLTTTTTYSAIWVFDGCPGTSGVVVVAAKSSSSNETLQFTQVSGSTYYVVVDTWPSPNCIPSYDLSIAELLVVPGCTDPLAANYNASATLDDGSCAYPPANDDCANAEAIACGASAVGNNTAASANAPGGGAAIWYSVVGQGGDITVSTCGTGFDTRLYVLDACGGTQVAYNDDANCIPGTYSSTSTTTFTSVSGTVYSIAVSGYSSSTTPGAVNISVSCAAAPVPGCTDSTATNYNVLATVDDSSCTYAPVSSMCCNSFAYGSATANPIGAVTISTCNYLSEYSTISGVDANTSYTAAVTGGLLDSLNPGWITVYEGSSCGTLVAEGTSPLTFTSTVAGTYYIHWSVDNTCATATGCHTTTIQGNAVAVPGCTDPLATNYNAAANVDDGSCTYPSCLAVAPYTEDFSAGTLPAGVCPNGWSISATSGNWAFTGNPGYNASTSMGNNRAAGTFAWIDFSGTDAGVVMQVEDIDVSSLTTAQLLFDYFSDPGTYVVASANTMYVEAYDGSAWNVIDSFSSFTSGWATQSLDLTGYDVAGVVSLRFRGESSGLSQDFYNDLCVDDVTVQEMVSLSSGCTNPSACNYDSTAVVDDGSCIASGCTDPLALNYDASAGCDDGSCNYNCANTSAYGSATADPYGAVTVSTCNYLSEYSTISGVGAGESYTASISGVNANPGYIVVYEGSSSGNFVAQGSAPLTWTSTVAGTHYIHWLVDSSCATATGCHVTTLTGNQLLPGCTDSTACNYNALAVVDDGSCILPDGCTDSTAFNYDPTAVCDDGSCMPVVTGCTDSLAFNYNALANTDDGSCITSASMCCNAFAYGSATASDYSQVQISTCNYLSEYSTISGVLANTSYTAAVTGGLLDSVNPGWITVYEGSSCGNFIGEGSSPLTFTSTVAGTYYIHWSVDNTCATATGCHTTTITGNNPPALGCTNPLAANYDSTANVDDGSCYFAGCTSGIGANQDGFETATGNFQQGPWTHWTYDAASSTFSGTNGWRSLSAGTGSSGTGPSGPAEGAYYLYCETSGQYGMVANLHSECVDLSNFATPNFVASYHMLGATMGTLNIDVSTDGGTVWNNAWTMSGDQGNAWLDAVVDLAAYSGQIVQVRMNYTSGTSFTGDCGIDNLRFMEAPAAGCMDPLASNYDPSATIDDGSCLYPGCMDPMAVNYCSTCNVNDSLSCTYPGCSTLPFSDDFESGSLVTNDWLSSAGGEAHVALTSGAVGHPAALAGAFSLEFAGGNSAGWGTTPMTEAAAFDALKSSHFATANVCLDLSNNSGSVELTADVAMPGYYTAPYRWMRVTVNGNALASTGGFTAFSNSGAGVSGTVGATSQPIAWDISAYVGMSSVNVTFETSCKYGPSYNTTYSDWVVVDDVMVQELSLCSYYAASATSTDVTCNGGSDGTATASTSSGSGMDMYMWTHGAYTASISGLAAGTYTCITMDDNWGCVDTVTVTVGEPSAMSLSAVVVDESAAGNDGSIDLSVSGGTACQTSATILSGVHASSYNSTFTRGWYFQAQSSFTVSDLMCPDDANPGLATNQTVAIVDYGTTSPVVPFALPSTAAHGNSFAAYDVAGGWVSIPGGFQVIAGNYYGLIGAAHAPGSTTLNNSYGLGGQTVVLDGIPTVQGRLGIQGGIGLFAPGGAGGGGIMPTGTNTLASNTTWGVATGSIGRIHMKTGVAGAQAYNYAWSTGDTTEDLSGLAAGTYGVTVTDCAGCTSTASYTVVGAVVSVPGCMDSTAFNYNPLATVSDSSCVATLMGCTDPNALNYYALANTDDNSCVYSTTCGAITGVNMTDVIHDRATFNWNDMNSATCDVDQIRIRYSDDNGATYSTKTMGAPVGNNAPALNTSKRILNLSASTTYVYDFKIWYQDGTVVLWHAGGTFTTAAICDNVTNVTVTPLNNVLKADFCWTAPSTPYSFVRLKYREDVAGSSFSNIGGMGVMSPTLCKEKGGLTPGTNYRVMWRTWCNPAGGPYRSAQWDGPVLWSQPSSIRVEGGTTINNLDVYPNPSRDIFNVSFTSEDVQDLDVRIINVIGEVVYTENLNKFVGEYTKQVDLSTYTKGVYFLEITTDNGVINKKLILQ